jgi:sec-independent protein translocase protein TatA
MGIGELFLILIIVVIVFGAGRLPPIGRALGEGVANFKEGLRKGKDEGEKPDPAKDKK